MANTRTETVPAIMGEQFGTRVLITDPQADRYLDRARKEVPEQKKFREFCGGKGGWSDFTERWH